MKKTPLQQVKDQFESKDKLVEAVKALTTEDLFLDRINDVKGLEKVSNAKLLRLHSVLSLVKDKWGSREKLIGSIIELEKRTKDEGFKTRLVAQSTPALVDLHTASARRAKRAEGKAPAPKKRKVVRTKKAKAKAAAKK